MTDQRPDDDPLIESDRDIPSVARRSTGQTIAISVFLLLCTGALGLVVWDAMTDSGPSNMVDADNERFEVNRRGGGSAFIMPEEPLETAGGPQQQSAPAAPAPEPTPEPVEAAPQGPAYDPLEAQRRLAMEQEALRLAREQARRLQERKQSPQLVFNGSTTAAQGQGAAVLQGQPEGAGALLGGRAQSDDPNEAFFERTARRDFDTARAIQLDNLETLVPQGTLIGGVLESAIQSDLPGQVRAVVSEDTYSMDQSQLLIPRGSRLIGRYRSGIVQGQTRVFVVWERLLRSDGVSIQVGSVGTDALGRAGVEGEVDTKFFERFGASILLSLIDGAIQVGVDRLQEDDTDATVAISGGQDFNRAAEIALENSINIPPTIHVDQGTRIKVFVGRDLDFSQVVN